MTEKSLLTAPASGTAKKCTTYISTFSRPLMMKRVSGKHNTLKNETYYGW
jgi:hypothetical protein